MKIKKDSKFSIKLPINKAVWIVISSVGLSAFLYGYMQYSAIIKQFIILLWRRYGHCNSWFDYKGLHVFIYDNNGH